MPYRVVIYPELRRLMREEWGLPDELLVDVYLRLEELKNNPARILRRLRRPVDGMALEFELPVPGNRFVLYDLVFLVRYGDDEQTLHVVRGGCSRTDTA